MLNCEANSSKGLIGTLCQQWMYSMYLQVVRVCVTTQQVQHCAYKLQIYKVIVLMGINGYIVHTMGTHWKLPTLQLFANFFLPLVHLCVLFCLCCLLFIAQLN